MMSYFDYLTRLSLLVSSGDIEGAHAYALRQAHEFNVPEEIIEKIAGYDTKTYRKKLDTGMKECLARLQEHAAKALYVYYDVDNGWNTCIYLCDTYEDTDPDCWFGRSRKWVDVGGLRKFASIYKHDAESAFFCDGLSTGIGLLLIVHTLRAIRDVVLPYEDRCPIVCAWCADDIYAKLTKTVG